MDNDSHMEIYISPLRKKNLTEEEEERRGGEGGGASAGRRGRRGRRRRGQRACGVVSGSLTASFKVVAAPEVEAADLGRLFWGEGTAKKKKERRRRRRRRNDEEEEEEM
ncbi:hypothetical protein TIFTF001_050700 [Ficus carica]|uniref:Uncharacterized protein n=1 Tax=Ficus carica TaxID=3494 RepID=A0AA87Z9K6_FICCA|nr:hypothetical protein TIFTF001_050700 [Ficus carica]